MNIVLTGAGRGIGYETAKQLCRSGHSVWAISRNVSQLQQLESDILLEDQRAFIRTIPFDLSDGDMAKELLPRIEHEAKQVDVLVNNAGTLLNKPFEAITQEELHYIYRVNVFAPFQLTQVLLPLMGGGGHIVNIGSMGAFQGSAKFPGLSAYSSSKAALMNLSELLAEELKGRNIAVNGLALGAAQTEMLNEAFPGYKAPLTAAEMGEWVAWFAVNGHRFFNGKVLPVALSTP